MVKFNLKFKLIMMFMARMRYCMYLSKTKSLEQRAECILLKASLVVRDKWADRGFEISR